VIRGAAGALAIVAVVTLAACSGGGDGSSYEPPSGPAQATATVRAGNTFFRPKTLHLPAGVDRIEMIGVGGVHTLLIEGVANLKLRVDGEGDRAGTKVRLKPGRYTFYCDIPGHREAGMEGTIRVT